jgi:glycosyltransferase involved in cell wall biosynthesis
VPLPENPQYSTQDVSIVVATIETPNTLPESLHQWLSNDPLEIIIVTIQRDLELVQSLVSQVPEAARITQIVTCGITNKREQLAQGIRMARGQIIALVDDDAFWPATTVLPYLLAGLEEDPSVGGVQGKQRYVEKDA